MVHNPYTYGAFILEAINSGRNKTKKASKRPEQGQCKMHLSPSPKGNQSQKKERGKREGHSVIWYQTASILVIKVLNFLYCMLSLEHILY